MTRYTQGFEGQTSGATVNVANSATSGTPFASVSIGSGCQVIYSPAAPHTGTLGMRLVYTDTAFAAAFLAVAPASATTRVTTRAYVTFGATAGSQADQFIALRAGSSSVAILGLTTSGFFSLTDAASSTVATSPTLSSTGTRYRLELAGTPGTTTANGTLEVAVYVGDSTDPFWSVELTGQNVGTAAISQIRFGRGSALLARTVDFDDLAADDGLASGFIGVGPFAVTAQPSNAPPRVQVTIASPDGSAITAVSLIRTGPDGTIATRVQPVAGPSPVTVFDYEAPADQPVTYAATITYAAGSVATYTSGYVTLAPAAAWLIHPTTPALSVCLDQQRFDVMGIVSIGKVIRPEIKTKHRIQGSEYQIVMKSGPRGASQTSMQVATVTAQERAALVSITRDQTPLLLQIPAAWGWDWENGYYDLADVGVDRILQYGPQPRRVVDFALERVEAPVGSQQAVWTWAGETVANASWNAVKAAYATWADVLTNVRR